MLALRLPADLEARLEALAAKTGRTKSFYAREAIAEYIDDLEDLYLAQKRQALRERGKTLAVPLSEVETALGLADRV